MTDSQTTKKPPLAAPTPRKVTLKRKLTQKQCDRLLKLMMCCGTLESDEKLEIHAGSHTFGGPPLKHLISEISMLLQGFEPMRKCRDVI